MTPHPPSDPVLAQGIPVRWWTDAEVRGVLARRATLDRVGIVSADQASDEHWECCFSVDGGTIGLRALVSLAGPSDGSVPEGAIPIIPPPLGSDAAHLGLRSDATEQGVVFELRVRAGRYLQQVELSLPADWFAARPPHPDVTGSLVQLHALLWGGAGRGVRGS